MTNTSAVRSLCTAMCSSFYPDASSIELILFNYCVVPDGEAAPKDPCVFRSALSLVMGYVESSRSENGISTSVISEEAIKNSVRYWCGVYGLNADEELQSYERTIENGSNLW